ncbi:hypothetical protein V1L54_27280 [Streptomyces sp. TRM 70361]|uniref:hypothetical protein n=1 Tax=Streptomyces sp. TRM 70361 TaxID=3116553 RepID=UPI002E7C065B|nr:hypothetical protein [Streptomyces sp. TRM 70361]MEE1943064.1 hypothetical protein [Streptomyces sp. TRM 70361]
MLDIHLISTTDKEPVVATDDLYLRYMAAFEASTGHTADCAACQADQPCQTGQPLHERLARLQDAYSERQSRRQR